MGKPWPRANIAILRADAAAGWTLKGCAAHRKFNYDTAAKHAKMHDIVFVTKEPEPRARGDYATPFGEFYTQEMRELAAIQLKREIAEAKAEARYAPPYKGHADDV